MSAQERRVSVIVIIVVVAAAIIASPTATTAASTPAAIARTVVIAWRAIRGTIALATLPQLLNSQGTVPVAIGLAEQSFGTSLTEPLDEFAMTEHAIPIGIDGPETRALRPCRIRERDEQDRAEGEEPQSETTCCGHS